MEYIRSATVTNGSTTVAVITNKLIEGMYIYDGNYLPIGTIIDSITDGSNLEMSNNATADGTINLTFSDLPPYKKQEMCEGLHEVQDIVNKEGNLIEFILRDETDITRGSYNSIKNKTQDDRIVLKAFPVKFNASTEYLEKVGLREACQVIIHTATLDWIDKGYGYEDISIIRSTIKMNGVTYKISEKTLSDYMGIHGLYIVFGLKL